MNELIPYKDESLKFYEKKLQERDSLRKEALFIRHEYNRIFGDIIVQIFEIKVDCISKKKLISYFQLAINRGDDIDIKKIKAQLEAEMKDYYKKLEDMVEANKIIKNSRILTEYDVLQIKKIYRKIAKKIHPDMNPQIEFNEVLSDLWQRVVEAYSCNELKELEELEILVDKALEDFNICFDKKTLVDIAKRIDEVNKEIETIKSTDPYMLKNIIESEEMVALEMQNYEEEKVKLVDYGRQLEEILAGLIASGGVMLC